MNTITPLVNLARTEATLQAFVSAAVTFATADNSIAATGIGTAFSTAGTKIVVSGAANADNNITFTISSVSSANKIIVTETVTAEAAGASVVINEEYQSEWLYVSDRAKLVGSIYASQACTIYIDQSSDASNTDGDPSSWPVVIGGTVKYEVDRVEPYARLRVRNNGTDQTALRATLNGGVL